MTGRLATLGGLAHPEWVAGRRLWLDPVMADIIDKIRDGDPTRGWEGDPQLAVFSQDTPEGMRWELMRLEDDNEYRLVARSKPGVVFDERIIGSYGEHLWSSSAGRCACHRSAWSS